MRQDQGERPGDTKIEGNKYRETTVVAAASNTGLARRSTNTNHDANNIQEMEGHHQLQVSTASRAAGVMDLSGSRPVQATLGEASVERGETIASLVVSGNDSVRAQGVSDGNVGASCGGRKHRRSTSDNGDIEHGGDRTCSENTGGYEDGKSYEERTSRPNAGSNREEGEEADGQGGAGEESEAGRDGISASEDTTSTDVWGMLDNYVRRRSEVARANRHVSAIEAMRQASRCHYQNSNIQHTNED